MTSFYDRSTFQSATPRLIGSEMVHCTVGRNTAPRPNEKSSFPTLSIGTETKAVFTEIIQKTITDRHTDTLETNLERGRRLSPNTDSTEENKVVLVGVSGPQSSTQPVMVCARLE